MSSIPYNYGSYIDAKVAMTDTGHVSAGKQIQSPASAGSRGLAKTTQFTNDRTQMQMGNSPIAESMIEIRNIMNRIDGINVPTNEMNELADDEKMEFTKILLDISAIKDRIERLSVDDDAKKSAIQSLKNAEEALVALDESAVQEDIGEKGRIALEKAGFDPSKIKEYLDMFNDHGDTSDRHQMNMDKVGLADAMSMVLASHDIENESYEPFPEEDEMTFEDDDAFYEAFGELGFPEDENELFDAEYRGRKVPLNKPMRGDVKKFKVYVKDPKSGNVKKVNFGHGGSSARKAG